MCNLAGGALTKRSIARMAEAAARTDLSKLAKFNNFSGPGTILAAIDQLRVATNEHANPWKIFSAVPKDEIMRTGPNRLPAD